MLIQKHLSGTIPTLRLYRTGTCTVVTIAQTTSTSTSHHQTTVSEHHTIHTIHTIIIPFHLPTDPLSASTVHTHYSMQAEVSHKRHITRTNVIPSFQPSDLSFLKKPHNLQQLHSSCGLMYALISLPSTTHYNSLPTQSLPQESLSHV